MAGDLGVLAVSVPFLVCVSEIGISLESVEMREEWRQLDKREETQKCRQRERNKTEKKGR